MPASCFVLKRLDTNEYYKGPWKALARYKSKNAEAVHKAEWSPDLKKAKRYKRSGDAINAARLKQPSKYWDPKGEHWANQPGVFVVETYELVKSGERVLD
jgi:hypothetical protein